MSPLHVTRPCNSRSLVRSSPARQLPPPTWRRHFYYKCTVHVVELDWYCIDTGIDAQRAWPLSPAQPAVHPHVSFSLRAKRRTAGTRSPAPRPHHRPPCSSPRRVSNEIPPVGMRAHSAQHTVFHTGTSTVLVVARQTGRMPAWWLLGLNSRAVPRCTSHRADTLLSRLPCCGRLARDLRP